MYQLINRTFTNRTINRAMLRALVLYLPLLFTTHVTWANSETLDLKLSLGQSFQVKNDVQIPNDEFGTRFSLADNVGEGPLDAVRFELNWFINEKHGLRVLLAPLSYTESVTYDQTINFAGETFNANVPTDSTYRFNSWRLGYHYTFINNDKLTFRVGGTLKVRDAQIRLTQGDTDSFDEDLGFVPLLHLAGNYRLTKRLSLAADLDGLAGGPGRAIDLGVGMSFQLTNNFQLGAELRVLEGGADIDRLFNFAQFNSASLVLRTGF